MRDLTGQRFGKWTVLERRGKASSGNYKWLCRCDCGTEREVDGNTLRNGSSTKCRHCFVPANRTKYTGDPIMTIFAGMRQRCSDNNQPNYKNYGGRGIAVCDEWLDDPVKFGDWAYANGYNAGLTIERIDANMGYTPDNCIFIPLANQALNRRTNRFIVIGDEIRLLSHWGKKLKKGKSTVLSMVREGTAIELSYNEFIEGVKDGKYIVGLDGEYKIAH